MSRLDWGAAPRGYEAGVDRGVLYLDQGAVPWNGLTDVSVESAGPVETMHYYDGNLTHISQSNHEYFAGEISAITYPPQFEEYNGYGERETRKRFGLSYRTETATGHNIHIVYDALVQDTSRMWGTLSARNDVSIFSWPVSARAIDVPNSRPTSHMVLNTGDLAWLTAIVEDILYGTDTTEPRLPSPIELVDICESAVQFIVTNHADGTYTVSGDDQTVVLLPDGRFQINASTLYFKGPHTFEVSSY